MSVEQNSMSKLPSMSYDFSSYVILTLFIAWDLSLWNEKLSTKHTNKTPQRSQLCISQAYVQRTYHLTAKLFVHVPHCSIYINKEIELS